MNIPGRIKTFVKDGAVQPYRICTVGSTDLTAKQAADGTTPALGVSNRLGAPDADDLRVDVTMSGIAEVEAGAEVTLSGPAMADADGKAIDATTGNYVIGHFLTSGTTGDRVTIEIAKYKLP